MPAPTIKLDAENDGESMPAIALPPLTEKVGHDLNGVFEEIAPGNRVTAKLPPDSPLHPFLTELWLQLEALRKGVPLSIMHADHELAEAALALHNLFTEDDPNVWLVYEKAVRDVADYDPERTATLRDRVREHYARCEAAMDTMDGELAALHEAGA